MFARARETRQWLMGTPEYGYALGVLVPGFAVLIVGLGCFGGGIAAKEPIVILLGALFTASALAMWALAILLAINPPKRELDQNGKNP